MTIEIYLDDLKEEKRQEVLQALGDDGNFDTCPVAVIEVDEE